MSDETRNKYYSDIDDKTELGTKAAEKAGTGSAIEAETVVNTDVALAAFPVVPPALISDLTRACLRIKANTLRYEYILTAAATKNDAICNTFINFRKGVAKLVNMQPVDSVYTTVTYQIVGTLRTKDNDMHAVANTTAWGLVI